MRGIGTDCPVFGNASLSLIRIVDNVTLWFGFETIKAVCRENIKSKFQYNKNIIIPFLMTAICFQ